MSQLVGVLSKLVQRNHILNRGLGSSSQPLGDFYNFLQEIAFSSPFWLYFESFQSYLKKLNCWNLKIIQKD